MGKGFRNMFLAPVIAALFLLYVLPVTAQEPDTSTEVNLPSGVSVPFKDSGEPPAAPDYYEIGSFAELTEWIEGHMKSGGAARLTNDIELAADERYTYSAWPDDPTLTIDVGEHTIYVSGHLELMPHLAFSGKGGENGIFHVKQGGRLELSSEYDDTVLSVHAEEGYAIYQEAGAFFGRNTDDIIGEIRYPALPVAWPFSDVSEFYGNIEGFPVTVLPLEGKIDVAEFPQTIASYLCENGLYSTIKIPVAWDFEKYAEQLAARERFVITGEYTGEVTAMAQPACLVTFLREDAAVFLQCSANKKAEDKLIFNMGIKLDDSSMTHRLEWSVDGDSWQRANAEEIDDDADFAEGDEYLFWWYEEYDGTIRYEGGFYTTELPRYFSIATTDAKGHTTYSDTVYLEGNDKVAGWDNGGNRGGGTGVTPPELPPLGGGTDDTKPNEPNETPPPVVKPPIENDGPEQSIPPTETPGQSAPPAVSEPPAQAAPPVIETPAPPLATEPPPAAVPDSPYSVQAGDGTSASMISSAETEPQTTTDVQEAIAQTEAETPVLDGAAQNKRTVAQAAVGITATGGIIALTMTWGHWSKRLIGLLRKLLKR